jgi:hypothetical protein
MNCVYSCTPVHASQHARGGEDSGAALVAAVDEAFACGVRALTVLWCPVGSGIDNDNFMALIESGETLGTVSDSAQFLVLLATRCDPAAVTMERYGALLLCFETDCLPSDPFADDGAETSLWHNKGMR